MAEMGSHFLKKGEQQRRANNFEVFKDFYLPLGGLRVCFGGWWWG